jgi:hypothetical protein
MGSIIWIFVAALVILGVVIWLTIRPKLFARWVRRAGSEFARNRKSLESRFFAAASTSGKPRGLRWKQCAFQDGVVLARDRANGELVALVAVTIGFEAVAGGGMEEVEAVANLRAATAVFTNNGRGWTTQGRVVFNLEPREVLDRYRESLEPVNV